MYKLTLYDILHIFKIKAPIFYGSIMNRILRSSKELGEAIRAVRKKQFLRQAELGIKASVRQALISNIENGTTAARLDIVLKVLAALNMDLAIVPRYQMEFNPKEY